MENTNSVLEFFSCDIQIFLKVPLSNQSNELGPQQRIQIKKQWSVFWKLHWFCSVKDRNRNFVLAQINHKLKVNIDLFCDSLKPIMNSLPIINKNCIFNSKTIEEWKISENNAQTKTYFYKVCHCDLSKITVRDGIFPFGVYKT